MIVYFLCTIFNSIYNLQLIANQLSLISVFDHTVLLDKYHPVRGKTYSLFGNCITTNFFYERVACLTDQILKEERLRQLQLLDAICEPRQMEAQTNSGREQKRGQAFEHPGSAPWFLAGIYDRD
jgi:hypothetical protein